MITSAVRLEQQAAARSVRGVPPRPLPPPPRVSAPVQRSRHLPPPVVDNGDESESEEEEEDDDEAYGIRLVRRVANNFRRSWNGR